MGAQCGIRDSWTNTKTSFRPFEKLRVVDMENVRGGDYWLRILIALVYEYNEETKGLGQSAVRYP